MYDKARFIIYYRSGNTKIEDREDPNSWDNAPKYEYICPKCGFLYPDFREVPMTTCLKCANENKDVNLVRQSIISALGVQFDPIPLTEEVNEVHTPVLSSDGSGRQLRMTFPPMILKGSSVFSFGWIQGKPAEQIFVGGKKKKKHLVHGLRIGRVVDPKGHVECMVASLAKGVPSIYSYFTTLHSLGIDESAQTKLHSIKLSECGKRIVTKPGEKIEHRLITSLGERIESE